MTTAGARTMYQYDSKQEPIHALNLIEIMPEMGLYVHGSKWRHNQNRIKYTCCQRWNHDGTMNHLCANQNYIRFMDHIVYWLSWNHSKEIIMDTWIRWNQYTNRAWIYIEIDTKKKKNGYILFRMESLRGMNQNLAEWEGFQTTTQDQDLESNHALLQGPSKFSSCALTLSVSRVFFVFPIVPWTHRLKWIYS